MLLKPRNLTLIAVIAASIYVIVSPKERQMNVFLTGYSYWDNTPRASAAIARPVIHAQAAGIGTFEDPITLAVGHSIYFGRSFMDFPTGTRFYFPLLRKYAIVEDLCGDGRTPQNGPCHIGYEGHPWLDIYVDGSEAGNQNANDCMADITGIQPAIVNPKRRYRVHAGPITEGGCQVF
ncbi:hypothetical protein [Sulfitobacter sp. SK011]|uniref:hypothetical protein n=1 Tax=Sulfitobacter sp. SK011 TaxID=1389004 RepID=UPI0020C7A891|nr:hypothetical protein [Sulfitobacter sp. SK011]